MQASDEANGQGVNRSFPFPEGNDELLLLPRAVARVTCDCTGDGAHPRTIARGGVARYRIAAGGALC
jgi:hypothetical protein